MSKWQRLFKYLHPEIMFIACNEGGQWRAFAKQPKFETRAYKFACGTWVNQGGLHLTLNGIIPFDGDWKDSCIERCI